MTEEAISLKEILVKNATQGSLYTTIDDDKIECFACGHRCKIGNGKDGICKIRFNRDGKLYVPYGYVNTLQVDPIEKKPFFHAFPGAKALSFGMLGCDYHCGYCQNWITSQAIRDNNAIASIQNISPEQIIQYAQATNSAIITSTYNEPLITSEWACEIFKLAKQNKLFTSYVSNGNGTPEVIEFLLPYIDLYKVDLKGFDDKHYRQLGGVLQNVLDTIDLLYRKNVWVEIVTLLVPDFNDSDDELRDIANFIASVSSNIPWHVTAFHPDYKMDDRDSTSITSLLNAVEIGYEAGLHFVYAGNIPGKLQHYENTYCPRCKELLIERIGFRVMQNNLINGCCPKCLLYIPGRW